MSEETITFESAAIPEGDLFVLALRGTEALSAPYSFTVAVQRTGDITTLDEETLAKLLREPASLWLGAGGRRVWGIVKEVTLTATDASARPTYELVLAPRLFRLSQTTRTRFFLGKTVKQIIALVLEGAGLKDEHDYELRLGDEYAIREYTLQYAETDLAFLSRILEREGIFYFFEHGQEAEGEEGSYERLIVADDSTKLEPAGAERLAVPFKRSDSLGARPAVLRMGCKRTLAPKEVVLTDYDWRTPDRELEASEEVEGGTFGVFVSHTEHFGKTPNGQPRTGLSATRDVQGPRLAKRRAELFACRSEMYTGTSTVKAFAPGGSFTLEDHVVDGLNQEYLLTVVTHDVVQAAQVSGAGGAVGTSRPYSNTFQAQRLELPFRPLLATPVPQLHGVYPARVDGKEGKAAPLDAWGRYQVILPFAMAGEETKGATEEEEIGKSSGWLRMAQPHGGAGQGFHMPLRPGTEVLIAHTFGDPDRPVIVGVVPNMQTPSMVQLANATQNIVRSHSGIQMLFEDNA